MAEALGIISSTIAICDLVYKLRKCCKRINAAWGVWEEYCEKLESLSQVQSVLTDMISGQTPTFKGGKGNELATLAAREIRTIEKQVKNILAGHDKWVKSSGNRIWDWLRVKRTSTKFVIVEEDLRGLIKSAEKAHDGNDVHQLRIVIGWPCSHTLIGGDLPYQDGINVEKAVCLCSDSLKAWTHGYGWELNSPIKSPKAAQDDNYSPLSLLQKVKRKDHRIPARIPLGLLVGYLRLIEGLRLEEEYLVQCYIWTDAIISEVSTSFDNAMAWTWVLWKLRRGTEFKRLTGIIQQQGKYLISQGTDRYGVILHQRIIGQYISPYQYWLESHLTEKISGAIDQKRISVLSQIRDLVQNNMETARRDYKITRTQDDPGWTAPLKIMSSSLMVGYLTLEYETFLLDGRTWDDGNFDRVSLADASGRIRSMMDLGAWMVKPVSPPVHTMPFALSGLMTLFPAVGNRAYEATVATYLSSDVYRNLHDLVRRLAEEDDWGADLPDL